MTIQPVDSGTTGRYGPPPTPFASTAYGKYHPSKDDTHAIFRRHLIKWRYETLAMSSIEQSIDQEDFRAIVALGEKVIPHIIREIELVPDLIMAALPILTGADPVRADHRGDMPAMASDWVDWYRNEH